MRLNFETLEVAFRVLAAHSLTRPAPDLLRRLEQPGRAGRGARTLPALYHRDIFA